MIVLGIETSCDDTAVALVNEHREILAHVSPSQVGAHAPYGGVVPEIAAREHVTALPGAIARVMEDAQKNWHEVDALAVTVGPGLMGGLMVGTSMGKALAYALRKPLIPVHHLEAHVLTGRLSHGLDFPYLALLVSGGHCQWVLAHDLGKYEVLGGTLDDAPGEVFDKVARELGLGYPGGPVIEKMAQEGDDNAFSLPVGLLKENSGNFSFSGVKSAALRLIQGYQHPLDKNWVHNMCASFQKAIGRAFVSRLKFVVPLAQQKARISHLVMVGGVASNGVLRAMIKEIAHNMGLNFVAPPKHLCTDNGAMVAWTGIEYACKHTALCPEDLGVRVRASWPLGM